jgi:glycosyltransferase involved in cell wall biosynthesis
MNFASIPYRAVKAVYHGIFNTVAKVSLRRMNVDAVNRSVSKPSIRLVSYYGWMNGISQAAVLQHSALTALGYDVDRVEVTAAMSNPLARVACERADVFVIHCGGEHFLRAAWPLRNVLRGGKVVAYFAWELPDPPRDWPRSGPLWDEIWTPSHHSARSLSQQYDCPIIVVPHVFLRDHTKPRNWLKGVEPLVFLTVADPHSSLSRKNPRGTVKAFQLAFPREDNVKLIVKFPRKGVHGSSELDRLLAEIKLDSRICLNDQTLKRDELDKLFLEAHVLVSLHRAEGFSLPLLEAQTLGLATIATAWSGNMDFTTAETSILIPYTIVSAHDDGGLYGNVTWAEPDIEAAAAAMRLLYDSPTEFARIASAGWKASRPQQQIVRLTKALQQTCLCNGNAQFT